MKNQLKILIPLVKKLTNENLILRVTIYSILILIALLLVISAFVN
jgi:hypothetical protein